jgi:hypothetical protein
MLPAFVESNNTNNIRIVKVANAVLPGLFHEVASVEYRVAPTVPIELKVTNIGARRVDLVWSPSGDEFTQMTITGYKIIWFEPRFPSQVSNLTVGNVTTSSVRGLKPAIEYVFAIAAVAEGAQHANAATDLYGRREIFPLARISNFSVFTNKTATLAKDFEFSFFNANATLNHSSSTSSNSLGPTGQFASEGNFGLVVVGSANIQNCNSSSTCCDGFNATVGIKSCVGGMFSKSVCAVFAARELAHPFVFDGKTRSAPLSNLPFSNGSPADIDIVTLDYLLTNKGAELPTSACGSALRLTDSSPRQSGASWYNRKMNVEEGFVTTFEFQISNPSTKCDRMDDVNTYCRSRGADGLAFVVQNNINNALGLSGSGLGYEVFLLFFLLCLVIVLLVLLLLLICCY